MRYFCGSVHVTVATFSIEYRKEIKRIPYSPIGIIVTWDRNVNLSKRLGTSIKDFLSFGYIQFCTFLNTLSAGNSIKANFRCRYNSDRSIVFKMVWMKN